MTVIVVDDIEYMEELFAFRKAISAYEYSAFGRGRCVLRTFEEAKAFEPKLKNKECIAFQVCCPYMVFENGSAMIYFLAGILYQRFKTPADRRKFLNKKRDPLPWRVYSREDLDDQLQRVKKVLHEHPDRGQFLHLVRTPVKPKIPELRGPRDLRNAVNSTFQPLPPIHPNDLKKRFS